MPPGDGRETTAPAIRFAERWADCTRTAAIYPDASGRVREALAAMRAALDSACATGGGAGTDGITVRFGRATVEAGGDSRSFLPGTNIAWLGERLRHAGLAGVRFRPGVPDGEILRFTRRLLSLWGRKDQDPRFEDLWPDSFAGVELVDWRFTGAFEGAGSGAASGQGSPPQGAGKSGDLEIEGDEAVARALAELPRVRQALGDLRAALGRGRDDARPDRELDVIGQVVQQAPHDLVHDLPTMTRLALRAIEELQRKATGEPDLAVGDAALSRCVAEAGRVLLGRADATRGPAPTVASAAPAHSATVRDAAIGDDPRAFREDLAALPPPCREALAVGSPESDAEHLGVLLHFLADPSEGGVEAQVRRHLCDRLAVAGPADGRVLGQYVSLRTGAAGEAVARRRRIVDFLRGAGLAHTLRTAGVVSADGILESFPEDFGLFLESADPRTARDAAELTRVLEGLRRERVLAARRALVAEEGFFEPTLAERLFSLDTPAVLPFIRLALEEGGPELRRPAISALGRIRGDGPEGFLLGLPGAEVALPRSYLLALTDDPLGGDNPAAFRRLVTALICQFVRESANRPESEAARRAAIGHLGGSREPEAVALLKELRSGRKCFLFHREPRAVREAAERAMQGGSTVRPKGRQPCARK